VSADRLTIAVPPELEARIAERATELVLERLNGNGAPASPYLTILGGRRIPAGEAASVRRPAQPGRPHPREGRSPDVDRARGARGLPQRRANGTAPLRTWRTSELRPSDADPSKGIVDLTLEAEIVGSDEDGERRSFVCREYLEANDFFIPDNLRNGGRRRPWIPVGLFRASITCLPPARSAPISLSSCSRRLVRSTGRRWRTSGGSIGARSGG
jgi:hypothetical protein